MGRSPEKRGLLKKESLSVNELAISSPSFEDFNQAPAEKLHATWQQNHQKIIKFLRDNPPPFFGLHGTNQEAFDSIQAQRYANVQMATFYTKEYEPEEFIFQLYHAAFYVSNYANKKPLGRILIFDLEKNPSENLSFSWEHLKCPYNFMPSKIDSSKERACLSKLLELDEEGSQKNVLWRSDIQLNGDDFDTRFKGSIDFNTGDLNKYVIDLGDTEPFTRIWRASIRSRFLAQEIIARTLAMFSTSKQ